MPTTPTSVTLLKRLTFLPADAIAELDAKLRTQPDARDAQRALAREMTTLVHGADATHNALAATSILFGGAVHDVSEAVFADVVGEAPTSDLGKSAFEGAGTPIVDLVVRAGLAASKGEGRRAVDSGGVYLNNVRVEHASRAVTTADLLFGKFVLLRKGKRSYAVVRAS